MKKVHLKGNGIQGVVGWIANKSIWVLFFAIPMLGHAQELMLKVHYDFKTKVGNNEIVLDQTNNGYDATICSGATVKDLGGIHVLQTGQNKGYLDMGPAIGNLIGSLADFTISTYLFIDPSLNLNANGNFVWTFSNSNDILNNANGCMFYSARQSRYAICPTGWWSEQVVSVGSPSAKGEWTHVAYTQAGSTGSVYVNGVLKKTGNVIMLPQSLGSTGYNYLARSCYATDQYLENAMYSDFRIYSQSLSSSQISGLADQLTNLNTLTYTEMVRVAMQELTLGDLSAVVGNIELPLRSSNGALISWSSSNVSVVSENGEVSRPTYGQNPVEVVLTASVSYGSVVEEKEFVATIIPFESDWICVQKDADNLNLSGNLLKLRSDLLLPLSGNEGSVVSWNSDNDAILSQDGRIVTRPAHGTGDVAVTLTATISKGGESLQKKFVVMVAEDEGFAAYLFAYFTGNTGSQEAIRFAVSQDGYTYHALNQNQPIIPSADISLTGGVRDPHILRGENGEGYYMVVTDMVSANGWNSNRGLVLMKSDNLVDWTSTAIHIPTAFPEFATADRVWAPQTIYDAEVDKYMVYFSMKLGASDYDKIYYAYAKDDFSGLESAPALLFDNTGYASIDADIVFSGGLFHLFFKTEGSGNGIKKAVSNHLTYGYEMIDNYLQSTTNAVEGGCVFRMFNTDTWILMYDMYTSGAYQFTYSSDLEHFAVVPQSVSFDFTPRHGTIIPITADELFALNERWDPASYVSSKSKSLAVVVPDPIRDVLSIYLNESQFSNVQYCLFDLSGNSRLKGFITSPSFEIDVSAIPDGFYLLKILSGHGQSSCVKVIVE